MFELLCSSCVMISFKSDITMLGTNTYLPTLLFSFTIQFLPIRWGICAPKQCSEEDVANALQDIFTGIT